MTRFSLIILVASALCIPLACANSKGTDSAAPATTTDPNQPSITPSKPTPTATAPDPDEALPPVVTSVSPDKGTVGSVGPSVVVGGNNFVARSIVQLDGAPLATDFVSGTELRATIPTDKLAAIGTLRLSVGTSPPGGGASKEVTFTVENPVATLTSILPLSVVAGAGATSIHVGGSGFVDGAKVVFGSTDLTTTFDDSTDLDATIPAALLGTSGSTPVKIVNPAPGGGDSTTIAFTITNPNASITNVAPSTAFVGGAGIPITVAGTGFVSDSLVLFNGTTLPTTFVDAGQLTTNVPAASFAAAGDFPVVVQNPPPGGGLTAPFTFHVTYPTPQVVSVSPTSASMGAGPTDVVVTGSSFYPASQITFNDAPAATSFVDAAHVKATLTAAQLAGGGTIAVRVVNPAPGGGASSALSFSVNYAVPTITTLTPGTVTAGSADKTITITGTGFVVQSSARSNGVAVITTYVGPTQVTAIVPASQMANPGSVAITVVNPAPGGGTSAVKNLVVGCDTSGVDVALGAVGNVTTLSTNFASAPLLSAFSDNGSCDSTSIDPNTQEHARYWVVQNTAGVPVTLSAWAVCSADGQQDDAYLTFYRRPTVPASDTERLSCVTAVAEGTNGYGGYASPDAGASQWCPGMTKANGGGLTLGLCEKAVVHMQAYSTTNATYTAPPTLKLEPE